MMRIEVIQFVALNGETITVDVNEIIEIVREEPFGLGETEHTVIVTKNGEYTTDETEFEVKTILKPTKRRIESVWF